MGLCQHRLSFSRAEIVLINSWMPVQQIVYHILRTCMKSELLANSSNNSEARVFNNYHIKTLMMWACELKSNSFWTSDVNLVRICMELLRILTIWLNNAECQHYFITDCNLTDNSFHMKIIASQLTSIDETLLRNWFVNYYIRKCSMLCPDTVSHLFSDVSTNIKLQNAISTIVNCRINSVMKDLWYVLYIAECGIPHSVFRWSLTVRSCICWTTALAKMDIRVSVYFTAVAFLHVSCKIPKIGFTDELMDVLATLAGQFVSTLRHPSQCSSELSLSKAATLMKTLERKPYSTVRLIEIELSKAYLHTALRCKESDSDSIYCLANVYTWQFCTILRGNTRRR